MYKIVVLSGSPRKKGNTMSLVEVLHEVMGFDDFEFEYLHLYDYEIKPCIGCKMCLSKDGLLCPFKDDVLTILDKLKEADGLILASPTYSRLVTGPMKTFIDRTNYVLHRPSLINKPTVSIATTDILMAKKVSDYLGVIGSSMGAKMIGSLPVRIGAFHNNASYRKRVDDRIETLGQEFASAVSSKTMDVPTIKQLFRFNVWKTRVIIGREMYPNDYKYWADNGWIDKSYFYEISLPLGKKIASKLMRRRLEKLIRTGVIYKE